VPKSILDDP